MLSTLFTNSSADPNTMNRSKIKDTDLSQVRGIRNFSSATMTEYEDPSKNIEDLFICQVKGLQNVKLLEQIEVPHYVQVKPKKFKNDANFSEITYQD
jgi:hypothetical protein